MIDIKISLVYLIIHLICVAHMFDVFRFSNYNPNNIEKIVIWLMAPEILVLIWIVMFIRRR